MPEATEQTFVDHPAPSIGLMTLFIGLICVLIGAFVPALAEIPREEFGEAAFIGFCCVMVFSVGVLSFYLWPLYTTYYTVDKNGITVRYGPWTHVSRWDDFKTVYWQKGMFVTKIGWPSINPCVRLSNGLLLSRKHKTWGLYITPNDPKGFIQKIEIFAPELTKEMIM